VVEIQDFGRGKVLAPRDRIIREFVPKIRLEVVVKDELWRKWYAPLKRPLIPGNWGDGIIFVINVEQALRIRTGERNIAAIRSIRNERLEEG
jgi:nitrogen regulatory protein P-II 1